MPVTFEKRFFSSAALAANEFRARAFDNAWSVDRLTVGCTQQTVWTARLRASDGTLATILEIWERAALLSFAEIAAKYTTTERRTVEAAALRRRPSEATPP